MIMEDFINCPKCAQKYECLMLEGAHVIMDEWESWGGKIRRIAFYESPYLASQFGRSIKTYPLRLQRVPGKKKHTWDYEVSCPVCGEFTGIGYTGVPANIDVFCGADRG